MRVYSRIHYIIYVHTPCLYVSFFDSFVYFVSDNGPLFLLPFLDSFPLHLAPSTMILHFKNHSHPFVTKRNTIQNDLSTIQHITRAYTQRTRPIDQPTARFGLETCALFSSRTNRNLSPIFVCSYTNYVILLIQKRTRVEQENCPLCIRAGKQRRD